MIYCKADVLKIITSKSYLVSKKKLTKKTTKLTNHNLCQIHDRTKFKNHQKHILDEGLPWYPQLCLAYITTDMLQKVSFSKDMEKLIVSNISKLCHKNFFTDYYSFLHIMKEPQWKLTH